MRTLFPVLLLAACSSGGIAIEEDTNPDDADTDGTNDTDVAEDTDLPDSPWAGTWTGDLEMTASSPDGEARTFCRSEATFTVDVAGVLAGDSLCEMEMAPDAFALTFTGAITADGAAAGEVAQVQEFRPDETRTFAFTGTWAAEGFAVVWDGVFAPPEGDVDYAGRAASP